jgi:hypothetical protein
MSGLPNVCAVAPEETMVASLDKYCLFKPDGNSFKQLKTRAYTLSEIQARLDACQMDSTWQICLVDSSNPRPLRDFPDLKTHCDVVVLVNDNDAASDVCQSLLKAWQQRLNTSKLKHRFVSRRPPNRSFATLMETPKDWHEVVSRSELWLADASMAVVLATENIAETSVELLEPVRERCCVIGGPPLIEVSVQDAHRLLEDRTFSIKQTSGLLPLEFENDFGEYANIKKPPSGYEDVFTAVHAALRAPQRTLPYRWLCVVLMIAILSAVMLYLRTNKPPQDPRLQIVLVIDKSRRFEIPGDNAALKGAIRSIVHELSRNDIKVDDYVSVRTINTKYGWLEKNSPVKDDPEKLAGDIISELDGTGTEFPVELTATLEECYRHFENNQSGSPRILLITAGSGVGPGDRSLPVMSSVPVWIISYNPHGQGPTEPPGEQKLRDLADKSRGHYTTATRESLADEVKKMIVSLRPPASR